MTYGIKIYNSAGAERLSEDDFVHRLMATGSMVSGALYTSTDVTYSGMSDTDEWFVLISGGGTVTLGTNKFTVKNLYYFGAHTFYYAVYRR
jgi:hypothetical protein